MDWNYLLRALAAASLDGAAACVCGLLLVSWWKRSAGDAPEGAGLLRWAAAWLLASCLIQPWLLAVTFLGQSSPRVVLAALPDVLGTHAGHVDVGVLVVSALLWVWSMLGVRELLRIAGAGLLLLALLALRSASGHAASGGDWTSTELLECVHLVSVALWSGGVLVMGFGVVPKLLRTWGDGTGERVERLMRALSRVSTWSVLVVIASGVVKAWTALGGDLHPLRKGLWGALLVVKVSMVAVAVGLGGLNRWWLRDRSAWEQARVRRSTRTLRMEAVAMAFILALSAFLAHAPSPGE